MSNGTQSIQRDEWALTDYTHMIQTVAIKRTRSVSIHHWECIRGFSFFDKDGALLWKIGKTWLGWSKETVELAENEVIVGVAAKLWMKEQSAYTDF